MNPYLKAMRLGRWPRSMALFMGTATFFFLNPEFLSSHTIPWIVGRALFSFLLTWAISTANYLINEVADAPYDAHHPEKRERPLIKGEVKAISLLLLTTALSTGSMFTAASFFPRGFFFSLLALLLAGFIYNIKPLRTKDIPFLDAISESSNNPIRFLIGWYSFSAAKNFPPPSLLLSWWAFGNFLLVGKRFSELRYLKEKAGAYRASLKKYSRLSLLLDISISALLSFSGYLIFAFEFELEFFFYLSPLVLLYFYFIFQKIIQEKDLIEEPERLLKNWKFALYTLFLIFCFLISSLLEKISP